MILKSVAYDLTCFMKVFDFGETWLIFVYNCDFNGPMFQGVKIRVESDDSHVCSLRCDLFDELCRFSKKHV